MLQHLRLEDISYGMRVRTYQLERIKGVHFLLENATFVPDDAGALWDVEGTVVYADSEQTDEYYEIVQSGRDILVLYDTNVGVRA